MSTDRFALGLEYQMSLKLTPMVPQDAQGSPAVNEKVFIDRIDVSYVDSGPLTVTTTDNRANTEVDRSIRSDYGTPMGEIPLGTVLDQTRVYTETGRRMVYARGRSEDIDITLKTKSPLGTRIAAISQVGTIIPQ